MAGGARFALLALPLLEMMVGGAAAGHSGHDMEMDGVRFAMKINGLNYTRLVEDPALKDMVMQQARYTLTHLCEVNGSAVMLMLVRGPTLVVGVSAPHYKVMELRDMIHHAMAAPTHESSITAMVVESIKLVPGLSQVQEGPITAGTVQVWGPDGSEMGASLVDRVEILMQIKGLSYGALEMYGEVKAHLMVNLKKMCAMLSEVPYDQVVGIEIRYRDESSVVAAIDVLTGAPHGDWLRRTIKIGAATGSHGPLLAQMVQAVPQVEMVLTGPIGAGELHVVPRPDELHHQSPPCECAKVWKWMGKTFRGCAETPDWVGKLWCMTVDNDRCHFAMASTVVPGMHWMECPSSHWMESGGWSRTWSEGDVHRSSHGEWHKAGGRMSKMSEHGHMQEAYRTSEEHGVDTMKGPAAESKHAYHEKHEAGKRETMSQAGHEWMAGAKHEHHTHGEGMKKLSHGGVQKSKHSHMAWEETSAKVIKRGPASHKAGMEQLVDCSMWEKLLGGDACMMMHAYQGEGRRLGGTVFV